MAQTAQQDAWCYEENWASQLLREKGHAIGDPEVWPGGGARRLDMRRLVDGVFMTDEEVINKASGYEEWKDRKGLFWERLRSHQDSLAKNA